MHVLGLFLCGRVPGWCFGDGLLWEVKALMNFGLRKALHSCLLLIEYRTHQESGVDLVNIRQLFAESNHLREVRYLHLNNQEKEDLVPDREREGWRGERERERRRSCA